MIISEKQIMTLIHFMNKILYSGYIDDESLEMHLWNLLSKITSQQSEELKVIE